MFLNLFNIYLSDLMLQLAQQFKRHRKHFVLGARANKWKCALKSYKL